VFVRAQERPFLLLAYLEIDQPFLWTSWHYVVTYWVEIPKQVLPGRLRGYGPVGTWAFEG